MDKVRCINNHWFDADVYSCCPHCGAKKKTEEAVNRSQLESGTDEKPKKKSFFWGNSKIKAESKESDVTSAGNAIDDVLFMKSDDEETPQDDFQTQKLDVDEEEFQIEKQVVPEENHKAELFTTKDSVTNGSDDVKTVSIFANAQGDEPVTGWIVGISGEYRGNSFQLKAGVNVIARDAEAYVCLKRDTQVSRACHAKIVYEPKKKVFYLGEGENSLTYCNDELVNGKMLLSAYDVIEIGGGKYLFIPFCGERFEWEKEAEPEDK